MSRYDSDLKIDEINTASLLINNIENNSIVLEFGPSVGKLTQYLKEEKGCTVYIVEIDEDFYNVAIKYAEDGLCEDIESLVWYDKFKHIKFDYILFADVLEHLSNPEKVLMQCKKLLKYNGLLGISIPNMGHNSILTNLMRDVFKYNQNGLLDETHIHFFTYNSIKDMLYKTGYMPVKEMARYLHEQENEFPFRLSDLSQVERFVIENKDYSDVYQFVIFATKLDYYKNNSEELAVINNIKNKFRNKEFNIYFDEGFGFNENCKISKKISWGENCIEFKLEEDLNSERIRLDFIENEKCVVKLININVNNEETTKLNYSGNYELNLDNIYFFNNTDPQLIIESKKTISNISINFYIDPYIETINLNEILSKANRNIQEKESIVQEKESIIQEKESIIQEKESIIQEKEIIIQEKESIIQEKENIIDAINKNYIGKILNKIKK